MTGSGHGSIAVDFVLRYDIYIKSLINKSEALFIGNKYNESKNVLLTLLKYKPIPETLLLKAHLSLAYTYGIHPLCIMNDFR